MTTHVTSEETKNPSKMASSGNWSRGLCGCFDDCGLCILSYIFPCVTFGQTAESMGKGGCMACGLVYLVPIANLIVWVQLRGQIREMRGIPGSCFSDCLTIAFCPLCALIQEAQELKQGGAPSALSMCRE